MSGRIRLFLMLAVLVVCVGCDLSTKLLAERLLPLDEPVTLLGDLVRFEFVRNTGAFLGLGSNLSSGLRSGLLVWGNCALLLTALLYALGNSSLTRVQLFCLALVVSGGVGNLIDRIWLGSVRDFVSLGLGPIRTGIFNVADVAVTAGSILLLWTLFRAK